MNILWSHTYSTFLKLCKFSFLYVRDLNVFFYLFSPLQYKYVSQENLIPSLTQTSVQLGKVVNHFINPSHLFPSL